MACDRQSGVSWFIIRPCLMVLALAMTALTSTTAQPQQPALPNLPTAACPPPQATLLPCISYFTSSNSSSPPTACCSQIQAMFESQAPCLCAAMAAAPSQLGAAFGAAQALLPSACDLPPNACPSGSTSTTTTTPEAGTTAAAAASPAPATSDAVNPTVAGGGGLKSVPGLPDSAAASSGYRGISAAAVLVSLFVANHVF